MHKHNLFVKNLTKLFLSRNKRTLFFKLWQVNEKETMHVLQQLKKLDTHFRSLKLTFHYFIVINSF